MQGGEAARPIPKDARKLRVLLVGSRILPFRHHGDKNFWLDVVRRLLDAGHELDILSTTLDEGVSPGDLPIRYVRPIPVYLGADRSRFNEEYRFLAGVNNYTSKTLSLPRLIRVLRAECRRFRPDVVHFADNYGPATIALRAACRGLPLAISAPTYEPNRPLYDVFLRMSFASFDAVVPFSDAYAKRLHELGLNPARVRRIRWGVDTEDFAPASVEARAQARAYLGVPADRLVVLWTGFTQQTGEQDLAFATATAERALADGAGRPEFLFCFKEEHHKPAYDRLGRDGLRVYGTREAFDNARASADLLLCPIVEGRSTAAPPLVWIETLAMGIPILTTAIPGGDEAVADGRSGATVSSPDDAAKKILGLAEDLAALSRLKTGARSLAVERFSVERATAEYEALWSALAA